MIISIIAVDECLTDNGGCAHICQNTPLSFTCYCHDGYTLRADGQSCDGNDKFINIGATPQSVVPSISEYQSQGDKSYVQKRDSFSIFSCSMGATLTSCYNQCLQRAASVGIYNLEIEVFSFFSVT